LEVDSDVKGGSTVTDDYELDDGQTGRLTSAKAGQQPKQYYK
jgi:hypothetical protein